MRIIYGGYKMRLKSVKLENYRKFGKGNYHEGNNQEENDQEENDQEENNKVVFAYHSQQNEKESEQNTSSVGNFDIPIATTLIIGKNNTGKSSIISLFKKMSGTDSFKGSDFNFEYLTNWLDYYKNYEKKQSDDEPNLPEMKFELEFELKKDEDIVSVIYPILPLEDIAKANREETEELENKSDEKSSTNSNHITAKLIVKVQLREEENFREGLEGVLKIEDDMQRLNNLLELINKVQLKELFLNEEEDPIKDFRLSDLIEIKSIEANTITSEDALTDAFNKIIRYRYKNEENESKNEEDESSRVKSIDSSLEAINKELTGKFKDHHEDMVNKTLKKIRNVDNLGIKLYADLTHEKLLTSKLLVYGYEDNDFFIPENQYGLGYTNLVMIIAKIIEYIEKSPGKAFTSKINLISIEEPETYMHPQLQELFIKNINDAVDELLKSNDKHIHSQIVITTHSSHILNSKIHSGNSFDYVNYCTSTTDSNHIINLKDNKIIDSKAVKRLSPSTERDEENLKIKYLNFLKKHIKYQVSELFFSDAVIFVEGVTEEVLIKYWLDQDPVLKYYYISVFNITGAHGLVYHNLIKQLKVPTLIVTDIDIKRTEGDEENIECVNNRETTNKTLIHYFGKKVDEILENTKEVLQDEETDKEEKLPNLPENLYITYQKEIDGFYPTSFEEALILKHNENEILKNALSKTMPNIYRDVHKDKDENLRKKSFKLQNKLSSGSRKSAFANWLLFELTMNGDNNFEPASYIEEGLNILRSKLKK